MIKADLHIHSNISDGSDSIEELAKIIQNNNINICALTDHDAIAGCEKLKNKLPSNIKFISGIELTSIAQNIKCHILGYNIDFDNSTLLKLIEKGKKLRREKLETRIKYLRDNWNIVLTQKELEWLYSRESVVKTHIANILVKRGLADNNIFAMKKYLDNCKTGNTRFLINESLEAIKAAGGIPIWAHPLGGEGEDHLNPNIFIQNLKILKSFGIEGIECYYSRYNASEIKFLVDVAKQFNLLISGGSDYHGSNKDNIKLAQLNTENIHVSQDKLSILNKIYTI